MEMPTSTQLNIPERLFILAIDDHQGGIAAAAKATLRFGLAGATLADLASGHNIALQEERVVLTDVAPTGDSLFDEVLGLIAAEKKPKKLNHWIEIIGKKQLVAKIADRMVERSVITIEKKRYRWVVPYDAISKVEASAKYWVKQQLRGVVLAGEKADPSDIALLGLLKTSYLLRLVFTPDESKFAGKKVDTLVKGGLLDEAAVNTLRQIEAAVAGAVT